MGYVSRFVSEDPTANMADIPLAQETGQHFVHREVI